MTFSDKGARYEFRVLAKNEIDYGERAVVVIDTPDGGLYISVVYIYFYFDSYRSIIWDRTYH